MIDCKPVDCSMDPNQKLMVKQGGIFFDLERYRRLVGKLTRPDLSFAVGVVSQFMQNSCIDHWNVVICILRYLKKVLGQGLLYEDKVNTQIVDYCDANLASSYMDRCSATRYCVLLGGKVRSKMSLSNHLLKPSIEQ